MTELRPKQEELCRQDRWDFTGLRALFANCTREAGCRSISRIPSIGDQSA